MHVGQIEVMSRTELVAAWEARFGMPPPKGLSRPFLQRFLAFECQAAARGRLPKGFAQTLARAAGGAGRPGRTPPALRSGSRLLREWNGTTHVVDVEEGGYRWEGRRYASLSAIAREITGAHWSGPRFFGLGAGARR